MDFNKQERIDNLNVDEIKNADPNGIFLLTSCQIKSCMICYKVFSNGIVKRKAYKNKDFLGVVPNGIDAILIKNATWTVTWEIVWEMAYYKDKYESIKTLYSYEDKPYNLGGLRGVNDWIEKKPQVKS